MSKFLKNSFLSLILFGFLTIPSLAFAQMAASSSDSQQKGMINFVTEIAVKGGYQTDQAIASTPRIIGLVIGAFLAFLGLTFVILMILAGYNWMIANGNEETVTKAKASIKHNLIGLIVALSGYTLWNFIFSRLIQ